MKIIFVGTSSFAGPSLKKLMADPECQISAVITQPDRRSGRGLKESFSPVKQIALDHELTVDQPGSINQSDSLK
ncbi:MAG: methionyl-tRNA formyltransferase, partial [Planctomycetes bacterium]|nr:methionyl-tRNA formyltransferase [Planctomycetota bacterium]